jgi:hypothetical protein
MHWAVELARFVLAAGGGEWSEPNMLQLFLLQLPLGLRGGWGETLHGPNCTETASHVTGRYESQQRQFATVSLESHAREYRYDVHYEFKYWI